MKYIVFLISALCAVNVSANISREIASVYDSVLERSACYNVYAYSADESWNHVCTLFFKNGEAKIAFLDDAGLGHGPYCHTVEISSGKTNGSLSFLAKNSIFTITPNTYRQGNEGIFSTRNASYSYLRLDSQTEEGHLSHVEDMKCD